MKITKVIVILIVVIASCALVAWLPVRSPCSGGVYVDHPGLQAECRHNLAYPGPGDDAYPAPVIVTPEPTSAAQPTPWELTPTSPPVCSTDETKCEW